MHHTLATRFSHHHARQISAREALTDDQLRQVVPSIFAAEAHDSRSDKYVYVPTIDIVQGLRREGWQPFFAVQAMPRDRTRTGHAKHMLRLRRPEHITESEAAEVIAYKQCGKQRDAEASARRLVELLECADILTRT